MGRPARPIWRPPRATTTTALEIYRKLQDAGKFAAGDKTYVDEARTVLEQIRAERAAVAR